MWLERPNSLSNATAALVPLADNGGFTYTHALGTSSDAIDRGEVGCGVSVDQRAMPRGIDIPGLGLDGDAYCDIGSFELQLSEVP